MKKIMHILNTNNYSGAENVVEQIITLFRGDTDFEMVYVSKDGEISSILKEKNIPFIGYKGNKLYELRKIIKDWNPDIIHAHDVTASILAVLCSFGKKCSIISHMHVNNTNMSKLNIKTIMYLIFSIFFKKIIWVSDSSYNNYYFKNQISSKSIILKNFVNKDIILEKIALDNKTYEYDICYVGRLSYQKNPERLIEVIELVKEEIPTIKFAIVGANGELFDTVRLLINEKKLNENIDMVGYMNNPLKLINDSKIILMTSRFEGLPMFVLEAMALGKPVVSTPVDGIKEIIENKVDGFLENTNEALSEKVIMLLKNPDYLNEISHNVNLKFEKEINIKTYKRILSKVYLEI